MVTERNGVAIIRTGKLNPAATMIYWTAQDAKAIVRKARRIAGKRPDISAAETALHRAASNARATLTEHATAMMRAGQAASKLDAYMASLKGTGVLAELNKAYRRKRMAAQLRGEGYMSYGTVMLRFRKALIPMLIANGKPEAGALFAAIFDQK